MRASQCDQCGKFKPHEFQSADRPKFWHQVSLDSGQKTALVCSPECGQAWVRKCWP